MRPAKVLRGGSFVNSVNSLRAANRLRYAPDYRSGDFGVRLATAPVDSRMRVLCGGSFYDYENLLRAAFRDWDTPVKRNGVIGFRLVFVTPHAVPQEPASSQPKEMPPMMKTAPDLKLCLAAVKSALAAIGRADLIPALDQPPPPAPVTEWIAIPAGQPLLGVDNTPTRVEGFSIARCAVTEHEWWEYCTATGQPTQDAWQHSRLPAVRVSWYDAQAYAMWLTVEMHSKPEKRMPGWTPGTVVRLPTEQEWEYAARGTDGRTYPWGNEWDSTKCAAHGKREPVDAHPEGASPFGVLGMSGNVWEWTDSAWAGQTR